MPREVANAKESQNFKIEIPIRLRMPFDERMRAFPFFPNVKTISKSSKYSPRREKKEEKFFCAVDCDVQTLLYSFEERNCYFVHFCARPNFITYIFILRRNKNDKIFVWHFYFYEH